MELSLRLLRVLTLDGPSQQQAAFGRSNRDCEGAMISDEVREGRVRQVAERRGLWLRKARVGPDFGLYALVDMSTGSILEGPGASLEQVESWLKDNEDVSADGATTRSFGYS